jgi:hypothetical protein
MSSSFFDLCPDILLQLFTYFSLNELFDTFIDSIPYLSSLINQSHIKLHIDKNPTENFWNRILPEINSNQIISLNNYSNVRINLLQFVSVRSMKLSLHSSDVSEQFQYLIHLEQLSLGLSEIIIKDNIWLCHILSLPNLKKLKLDLMILKNTLQPQNEISIKKSSLLSNTIKYLELKIPMSWKSFIHFLEHFPNLQILRASLYQLNTVTYESYDIPMLNSTLHTLDLQGYFKSMSSIVTYISTSMPNLKRCRLIAMNATDDSVYRIRNSFLWQNFFDFCSHLTQVKIHLLMSIEENNNFNVQATKDLMRAFNNDPLCEKYNLQMEQRSLNRGYVTFTVDYDVKKIKL